MDVYQKNGWILNITVTDKTLQKNQSILNYITAPDVVIWSACICSCAIPDFYEPQELLIKNSKTGNLEHYHPLDLGIKFEYVDGSISCDVPCRRIGELFNVSTFIVQ